jgi:hypothetical protein
MVKRAPESVNSRSQCSFTISTRSSIPLAKVYVAYLLRLPLVLELALELAPLLAAMPAEAVAAVVALEEAVVVVVAAGPPEPADWVLHPLARRTECCFRDGTPVASDT